MIKIIEKNVLVLLILIGSFSSFGQPLKNIGDSVKTFVLKKCLNLLKPHSDLTFSFNTEELKNEMPDLKIVVPELKDTAKYLQDLKGNYNDWDIYYKIGQLYQRFNNNNSAFVYYEQAYGLIMNQIKKDSLNSKYYSDLGVLCLNLKSNDNSFYFFKKAYDLNPDDSLASTFLPMFYIRSSQFYEAEKIIQAKLKNEPANIEMYVWMITNHVFKTLNEIDKENKNLINQPISDIFKLQDFTKGIEANKNDIRFLILEQIGHQFALFVKYMILNDDFKTIEIIPSDKTELENIRKSLNKFLEKGRFKNQYILNKTLGFNYLLSKNTNKAIEYFKKSITCWPSEKVSQDYYILFTTNYFIKNDTIAAINVIDEKIKLDKLLLLTNSDDLVLKGNVLLSMGKDTEAIVEYKSSLELNKSSTAYQGMTYIEMKNGRLTEANQLINFAYEINKNDYLTYALFGSMMILNNQIDEAKSYFTKALELKPNDDDILELYQALWPH